RPYLMGALLMNEIARVGGPDIIKDLNLAYSRRIPFFINGPVQERLGVEYQALLMQAYLRAERIVNRQLDLIDKGGKLATTPLIEMGYFTYGPEVSSDGRQLAVLSKAHNIESFIAIVDRPAPGASFAALSSNGDPDPPVKPNADGTMINRASWVPDGS